MSSATSRVPVTPTGPSCVPQVSFNPACTPNDPTEGLPPLKAGDQRKYNKLSEEARSVIMMQQPAGFRESTRAFTLKMLMQNSHVNDKLARETPYNCADTSDPFLPNHLKVKAKLTPSDHLKDNAEAKKIMSDFNDDLKNALMMLSKHCHLMAKLETKQAKAECLIEGAFS